MKKITLIMAVLAMLMVLAIPALAEKEGVNQDLDQSAESGNVNQSFDVTNTGDNSNQCAGVQGVANTGNTQNQIGVLQYGSEGDMSFEDVGSSIEVSPENSTECHQSVNQSAVSNG